MQKRLFKIVPIALLFIVGIALSFLISFNGLAIYSNPGASISLFLSATGGKIGGAVITLLFCIVFFVKKKERGESWGKNVAILIAFFAVLFVGVAQLNEHVVKEQLRVVRPNILQLAKEYQFKPSEIYQAESKKERAALLAQKVNANNNTSPVIHHKVINTKVWKHWLNETGYSFPSGHSVNAFLMAIVFSYLLLLRFHNITSVHIALIYLWAFLIAYSRILLGVHSSLDITLGAIWGSVIGFLLIITGVLDRLYEILQKRKKG